MDFCRKKIHSTIHGPLFSPMLFNSCIRALNEIVQSFGVVCLSSLNKPPENVIFILGRYIDAVVQQGGTKPSHEYGTVSGSGGDFAGHP